MKRPKDAKLPGLEVALNPSGIRERLREVLPECQTRFDLERVDIFDVRYKPETHCFLLYRLKLRNKKTRKKTRQIVGAQVLRAEDPIPALPDRSVGRYRGHPDAHLATPSFALEEERIVGWSFPLDPELPTLPDASDPREVRRELSRLWKHRGIRVRKVDIQLLGYTPQARASFLYTVLAEDRGTAVPEQRRLIAKAHTYKKPARLFADAWSLWRAADGRIGLAPPVGYLPSCGVTLQEQVEGEPLGAFEEPPRFLKPSRALGRSVAAFHGVELPLTKVRGFEYEAKTIRRWARVLQGIRPRRADRLHRLQEGLLSEIESRIQVVSPIHGDFHHRNVLVDGERVTIIDLDDLAVGDPMVDVGRFMASLRVPSMRIAGDPDALHAAKEGFLDQYLKKRPDELGRARLFEASSLLTAASSAFRIQRKDWEEQIDYLISQSQDLLEESKRDVQPRASVPAAPELPALARRIEWAEDPVYMKAALDPLVEEEFGVELSDLRRITTQATSRGYQFRYDLSGRRGGKSWRTTLTGAILHHQGGKGVLRRLDRLRDGLDASSDAPLLPSPVGYLQTLGLLVVERPTGVPVAAQLEGDEAHAVVRRVAKALRAVHRAPTKLDKHRSIAKERTAVAQRLIRLQESHPALYRRAERVLKEVEQRTEDVSGRKAPILRSVRPGQVHSVGELVAFREVSDPVLSHPYLDVASFLSGLWEMGLEEDRVEWAEDLANEFRSAYELPEERSEELLGFELSALLARASSRKTLRGDGCRPELLLLLAERMLEAA